MAIIWIVTGLFAISILYVWHVNRGMTGTPPEAARLAAKRWTKAEIRDAYQKARKSPTDVKAALPQKQGRRYIVVGGSGLVGGWIVQHLLWRGEDPAAIRILDLSTPTRPEIVEQKVQFLRTDVSDRSSVSDGFTAIWQNRRVAQLPLTVFHTVAYISAAERKKDFLEKYEKVNIIGTQHVLDAARAAGTTVFVATSSASVGLKPPQFLLAPWQRWPTDMFQLIPNAEPQGPRGLDAPLEAFGTCYAFSKARAEKLVRNTDNEKSGFRTGSIRPGHAIYGAGVESSSSVTWDYLRRGGAPTWLTDIVSNFVNAQNVSIAHLAFEATLLRQSLDNRLANTLDVGGRVYCCTDPNPPITYGHVYDVLSTLAHPTTVIRFPLIPPAPMLLIAYAIESYILFRHRYMPFLPKITGDLASLTPAIFNVCTAHIVYDDSLAKREIGYNPPIRSLEGLCLQLIDWNDRIEKNVRAKVRRGEGGDLGVRDGPQGQIPAVSV